MNRTQPKICVIGAGMSGILMTIRLMKAGYTDITVIEKARSVGGTWRDNTYPGLHCDVPSVSYCYSFEPSEDWSKRMSAGADIRSYFEKTSRKYGVDELIRFNTEVTGCTFENNQWNITTSKGDDLTADFIVSACGVLHHPVIPDFEGKDSFEGDSFHTSQWDHSVQLEGKRIGIIGTGSTSVQMVLPLSKTATNVTVFQRTAQWIFPMPNRRFSKLDKALSSKLPSLNKASRRVFDFAFDQGAVAVTRPSWQRKLIVRAVKLHLLRIRDPELRAKLTPDYDPLCKRMVMNETFYTAVQKSNVDLVTEGIEKIEPNGIRTKDGKLIELDIIVFSTGFDTQAYIRPIKMTGVEGKTLEQAWENGPKAYRSVAMPGFPNFFMVQGPNAPVGNFSLISTAETQTDYIMKCLELYREGKCDTIVPTQKATDDFNAELKEAMKDTVWVSGCDSWYISKDGTPLSWPWGPQEFRASMIAPELKDYTLEMAPAAVAKPKKAKSKAKKTAKA